MYVDGAKRRTEQQNSNGELGVILRGDVNMMYTVLVARGLYRVSAFDPKSIKSFEVSELAKEIAVTGERFGTETINGEACDKYRYSGFIRVNQSTHLPVQSETATAPTVWQNLNLGRHEPHALVRPANYSLTD